MEGTIFFFGSEGFKETHTSKYADFVKININKDIESLNI